MTDRPTGSGDTSCRCSPTKQMETCSKVCWESFHLLREIFLSYTWPSAVTGNSDRCLQRAAVQMSMQTPSSPGPQQPLRYRQPLRKVANCQRVVLKETVRWGIDWDT